MESENHPLSQRHVEFFFAFQSFLMVNLVAQVLEAGERCCPVKATLCMERIMRRLMDK